MSEWVKINNDIYHIKDCVVQLSVMSHATINIEIDLKKYPTYSDIFFNMYDSGLKFDLIGRDFDGRGTQIKSIDCNSTRMNISLRCDILNPSNILERRDEIIDDLLNNEDKNNIN
jgi:hypothetical protein